MKRLFPILFALSLVGCASSVLKKDEIKSTRKAAIVGWDLSIQRPAEFSITLGNSSSNDAGPMGNAQVALPQPSEEAAELYDAFAKRTEKATGFAVVPRAQLEKHPAYARWFKEYTEGFQNRNFVAQDVSVFRPAKVLDTYSIMKMKTEDLEGLRRDLGVDMLIIGGITTSLEKRATVMSLVGGGNFVPKANLNFTMFKARFSEPIWRELNISAIDEKTKIESFAGFADVSKTQKGSLKIARAVIENAGAEMEAKLKQ